jgi:hypothetical protein
MSKYVVLAEYKDEGALIHEAYLHHTTYEIADERMKFLAKDPRVIRVAMAKLVFERGHPDLLPPEPKEMPF